MRVCVIWGVFLLVGYLFLLTTIIGGCKDDNTEPEPPILKPSLKAWATPDSVAFKGSSTFFWETANVTKFQIGILTMENFAGGSVTYANLLKDTSIFCSATGYNNQVIRDTVYIKVAQPPVVPKTAKDTLMSMYWMLVEEIIRSSNRVDTVNLSEASKTNKLRFGNEEVYVFNKNGFLVGSTTYFIKSDSIKMGGYWYRYLLTKSFFTRIQVQDKDTIVSKYSGYKD